MREGYENAGEQGAAEKAKELTVAFPLAPYIREDGEQVEPFICVKKSFLRIRELSMKAKFLMIFMLSLPEDWKYSIKGLSLYSNDGLTSVRSAVDELEANGLVTRISKLGSGAIYGFPARRLVLFDEGGVHFPTSGNPTSENPTSGNPTSGNRTQQNNIKQNTEKRKTENIKTENRLPGEAVGDATDYWQVNSSALMGFIDELNGLN